VAGAGPAVVAFAAASVASTPATGSDAATTTGVAPAVVDAVPLIAAS
jgi:hypothetical protein